MADRAQGFSAGERYKQSRLTAGPAAGAQATTPRANGPRFLSLGQSVAQAQENVPSRNFPSPVLGDIIGRGVFTEGNKGNKERISTRINANSHEFRFGREKATKTTPHCAAHTESPVGTDDISPGQASQRTLPWVQDAIISNHFADTVGPPLVAPRSALCALLLAASIMQPARSFWQKDEGRNMRQDSRSRRVGRCRAAQTSVPNRALSSTLLAGPELLLSEDRSSTLSKLFAAKGHRDHKRALHGRKQRPRRTG